ncbi:hypothetical protein ABPG75_001622 [Micractinium tetrahymenae]
MSAPNTPLLLVFWPSQLRLPDRKAENAPLELLGWSSCGQAVQEVVVTGTRPLAAAAPDQPAAASVVGTLLPELPADGVDTSCSGPSFMLLPTAEPGGPLPVLVPAPATQATAAGATTRRRRQQAAEQQQQQQGQQCQIILYEGPLPSNQKDSGAVAVQQEAALGGRHSRTPGRRQLAASLASHLAGALLAALLLAHWHDCTATAVRRSTQLAGFVSGQLSWFMASQPAGVKLHRHLSELLAFAGLQYTAGVLRLLAGRGQLVAGGVLAAALLCGGLQPGLLALEWLLWVAGLPLAAPYAAMAAVLRWQLRCTALMWRVMRGKQQLAPLRHRLAARIRAWRAGSGAGSRSRSGGGAPAAGCPGGAPGISDALFAAPQAAAAEMASFSHSPGSGLKQLSGAMLLFMPLLLLLPTTAWYYGFALLLHAAASAPRAAVRLARQLVAEGLLGAALGPLPQRPTAALPGVSGSTDTSSSGSSGGRAGRKSSPGASYALVNVQFSSGAGQVPLWAQHAAAATTYLRAEPRRGSLWWAAMTAAGRAWLACGFASTSPGAVLGAALCGRPLFLGRPAWLAGPAGG